MKKRRLSIRGKPSLNRFALLLGLGCLAAAPGARAQAPSFAWVKTAGGIENDYGGGIAVDCAGHIVVAGALGQSARFGPTNAPARGMFVAKYDSDGDLMWLTTPSTDSYSYASDLALDRLGNIVLAGSYVSVVSFGTNRFSSAPEPRGLDHCKFQS